MTQYFDFHVIVSYNDPFHFIDCKTSSKQGDDRDDQAKKAYEALMTIRVFEPTSSVYKDFEKEVILRREMNYNITTDHDRSSVRLCLHGFSPSIHVCHFPLRSHTSQLQDAVVFCHYINIFLKYI